MCTHTKNTTEWFFLVRGKSNNVCAQGAAADSVRLLLTKNPIRTFCCPGCRVSRLNGSRDPGRQHGAVVERSTMRCG